jgi:hypothetical protein
MSRGKVTVGYGTSFEKEMEVVDFFQAKYSDNRLISICEIENGSLLAVVENPQSTGRNTQSSIWLSKESFIGMISTAFLYFEAKGESFQDLLKSAVENGHIDYTFSDNLNALDEYHVKNKKHE